MIEDRARRERLQKLDSILDRLERLNLEDSTNVGTELREELVEVGVRVPPKPNITELIERIWELQEEFLEREDGDHRGVGTTLH